MTGTRNKHQRLPDHAPQPFAPSSQGRWTVPAHCLHCGVYAVMVVRVCPVMRDVNGWHVCCPQCEDWRPGYPLVELPQ